MQKVNYAGDTFEQLLCQSLSETELLAGVAALLDQDPCFLRGHLEMLWNARKKNHWPLYNELLNSALASTQKLYRDGQLRQEIVPHWTPMDFENLQEILQLGLRSKAVPFWKKVSLFRRLRTLSRTRALKAPIETREQKYMAFQRTVDVRDIVAEVNAIPPYWWAVQTRRQQTLDHHKHSQSIAVRVRAMHDAQYAPVDGIHESEEVAFSKQFPKINALVLDLAQELDLALGRVVLVRLSPHSQVYRHYDDEEYLKGRDRYHLVLICGDENILESGDNRFVVKPGELWFFDNKVMHRACNLSSAPRIHIIFDGYPLEKLKLFPAELKTGVMV
ncbi:aspartyl/asparaginyl beta-hydroxylase domain-containing protein [Polaromonas sp.]|uniref:aspartyl/asparaginyl beta-hydroxylase domain-containing protein n=1 Tax=Polaromonas sp. TaxID=1869339 RepID=UPI0032661DB0